MKGIVIDMKDLSDSREVMESRESPKISWFLYILLAVLTVAIVMSCFFEVDEYSKVSGEIKTMNASASVISPSNCKIKEICVSEGQSVKTGDVLFVLDADYAKEQKEVLSGKLDEYKSDLENTGLLKESIEKNKNLFENSEKDSKYYYRYEQYKNGILISAEEIGTSKTNNSSSAEEKKNELNSVKTKISEKSDLRSKYRELLDAVENEYDYSGDNAQLSSSYDEYITNYRKAQLLCEQYRNAYENVSDRFSNSASVIKVSSAQVESAKLEAETSYSLMSSYRSNYISEISSQLILLENQLINDSENAEAKAAYEAYSALKQAVEKNSSSLSTSDKNVNNSFSQYIASYNSMAEEYKIKQQTYQDLYNTFAQQNSEQPVTEDDVRSAEAAYENAQLDAAVLKSNFVSKIQSMISSLDEEIKSLEATKQSLDIALNGISDLDNYEKLSTEKLKTEAIISINAEIDQINDNITSLESQLSEVKETIKNAEICANVDGTITLVSDHNSGDIIQAGSQLCSVIPQGNQLKAVLYIPEYEISKVSVGQKTEYAFDAIPYNEYGKVTGEITSISADSVMNDANGAKYYVAQASLSTLALSNSNGNVREVKTGMLVEAKTISNSKKVIIWLLEKIDLKD